MRNVWNVKYSLVPRVRETFEWKKGNPGGLGGKFPAHNLVVWHSFQWDPTVNSENVHNTE